LRDVLRRERLQPVRAARDLARQSHPRNPSHLRRKEVIQLGKDERREQQGPIEAAERFPGGRVKTLVGIQDGR